MLFRKKIEKSCSYCKFGAKLEDEEVLCAKRGLVPMYGKCRKFQYDPLKRIPHKAKAQNFDRFNEEDFSL